MYPYQAVAAQVNQGSGSKYKFPFNMVLKFDVKLMIWASFLNYQIYHLLSRPVKRPRLSQQRRNKKIVNATRPARLRWERDPLRHLHFICCGIIPRALGRISLTSDTGQSLLPFYLTNGGLWEPTHPMAQAPKPHKSQLLSIEILLLFAREFPSTG